MIRLSDGGGGEETNLLIRKILRIFDNEILKEENDAALLDNIAFTTDSFVVSPIFFNGGDIGKLSVCGSVNDLSMVGASAKYLSCGLIIEEGFPLADLTKIITSMQEEAIKAKIRIVTGDTKVVPKGACDKIYINTSGIGEVIKPLQTKNIKAGDKILISGDIGRHGAVILASREELNLSGNLSSDCRILKHIMLDILDANFNLSAARDATRGGISSVLHEWSAKSGLGIKIYEENINIDDSVLGVCEILGFSPFELACEGTFLLVVDSRDASKTLELLKQHDNNASEIGEIVSDSKFVTIQNAYGVSRFLDYPKGELLPRIC